MITDFPDMKSAVYLTNQTKAQKCGTFLFLQGFEPMIDASESGLPVDLSQVSFIYCPEGATLFAFLVN